MFGTAWNRVLLTAQLMSGAYDFEPACVRQEGDILNKLCDYVSNSLNGQRFQLFKLKYEDILLYFVCNLCQFRIVVYHKVVYQHI